MDKKKYSKRLDQKDVEGIYMSNKDISILESYCMIPSASGFEKNVQNKLKRNFKGLGLKETNDFNSPYSYITFDSLGNLYAKFSGEKNLPSVAYLAHADSPAFMITTIDESGFISADPIGMSIDRRLMQGRPVLVGARGNKTIPGAFASKHIHLTLWGEEDETATRESILIDCGSIDREMLEKRGVSVGNPVFFEPRFKMLLDEELCQASNLDDRVGTFVLHKMAKHLIQNQKDRGDVYLISTVSEEIDPQGSKLAAKFLASYVDVAIAIDSTYSIDYLVDSQAERLYSSEVKLSRGPVIKKAGFNEKIISDVLKNIAKKRKIEYQIESDVGNTSTDEIWFRMVGVPTSALCIATRNLHTPVETIDTCDLEKLTRIAIESPYALAHDKRFLDYINSISRIRK